MWPTRAVPALLPTPVTAGYEDIRYHLSDWMRLLAEPDGYMLCEFQ